MDVKRRGSGSSDMSFFNKKELKKLCSLRLTTIQPRNVPSSPDQKKVVTPAPCIKVGICAMKKKTQSRPMQEILRRLRSFGIYDIIVFSNETILNEPIESWPIVECLIAFFSRGFPLEKAVSYVDLRRPFVLNDLRFQYLLQDRRQVYKLLESDTLVKIPRYAIINRDASGNTFPGETEVIENDDWIEVNGKIFHKPFVEKPVNAENHNICIYYPSKAGGGCQKLFRKVGNRSSIYCPDSCVRRTGSYIYEDFMTTDGTDVKTYTVGEEYAHAEARKSPALDGKVERDAKGKEIRYPVILSAYEKLVAKRVCKLFKQTVCGFDILRTNGKSLVCDVNGFSFVKTSQKYYDDCSQLLADIILTRLAPHWKMPLLMNIPMATAVSPVTFAGLSSTMELRSVVAIMRHGDRTPKQKVKMMVTHRRFFELFRKYDGPRTGALKLKQPSQLQEVLDITKLLLEGAHDEDEPMQEDANKLQQMKTVLEMYDHFSGINRKIQIKSMADQRNLEIVKKFRGRNKKSFDHNISSLLLILKWGGELTPMGEKQAEELGKAFRCLYPGGQGEYGNHPGLGFLRLHSTYRHDLKIYASDEGRVQMTAAAFAKGLLALEGGLTPILVHLVKSDAQVTSMLDYTQSDVTHYLQKVKTQLHDIMISNKNFTAEDEEKLAPCKSKSITEAMRVVQNPQDMCQTVYELVKRLTTQIREKCSAASSNASARTLYHEESLDLMLHRWSKLETDFINDGQFDISLIPDIYDCVKYDYVHNRFVSLDSLPELYRLTKALADLVVPQEYGISVEEKLDISRRICNRLLNKIRGDLQSNVQHPEETAHRLDPNSFLAYQTELAGEPRDITSPHRHVRTRLYFTSESHVHSVINTLRYGPLFGDLDDEQWENAMQYLSKVSELNYLTQIVFMQYEDLGADPSSPNRFHTEIFFSPGLKTPDTEEIAFDLFNMSANLDDYPENRDVFVQVPVKVPSDDAVLGIKNRANMTGDRSPIMKRSSSADELASAAGKSLAIRPMSFSSDATFSSSLSESQAQPVTGAEVIYTLPYLQPLVALHSSVSQEQMDAFFDVVTTEDEEHNLIWSTAVPGKGNSFHGVSYEHPLVEQMRC